MKKIIFIVCGLLLGYFPLWGQSSEEPLLKLLKQELHYNMQELKKQELKPYFMNLRVRDEYSFNMTSSFGAISATSGLVHTRTLIPQIRIGSPVLDNFKYNTQGSNPYSKGSNKGALLPLTDDSPDGVRQVIWNETLNSYKIACGNYQLAKMKAETTVGDEDKANCFSSVPVEKYYEAPLTKEQYSIDVKAWEKRLNEVSAVFKSCPELQNGSATLDFQAAHNYLVTSEGSEIVQNRISMRIIVSAVMVAADGMSLPLNKDYFAYSASDLPSNQQIIADAKDLIKRLLALRDAPVANPYTGPAILSGPASGVFFHEIFGHRLEGHRLKTGGETFKKMVGKEVLPKDFQVYSDPTLHRYADIDMHGYYMYDDEGVKARRIVNVQNGILKSFLLSRVPLEGFPESNGHGRSAGGADPVSRQSNLIVETNHPFSETQLRNMLRIEAKRQGKEYGYYFKSVTSGYTLTGEGGSLNSFNVTPLEVYRVFVDGRPDQLVRGVDMIGTPLSMFSNIVAAGDKESVFTGMCGAESGWVPVTAASPMIYVSKIETQRRQQKRDLPSILPAPTFTDFSATNDTDNVIFSAMSDEMQRNRDLHLPEEPKPFYLAYTASRTRLFRVVGQLGGILYSSITPFKLCGGTQVLTGDYIHSSELDPGWNVWTNLPVQIDYNNIRRSFWSGTGQFYRFSLASMLQKKNYLKENPLSVEDAAIPDMSKLQPVTYVGTSSNNNIDCHALEKMASDVSSVFCNYKDIYDSKVSLNGIDMNIYRYTSEGAKIKIPQGCAQLIVSGKVRAKDGSVISDELTLFVPSPNEYPNIDELQKRTSEFAKNLLLQKDLPIIKEKYVGPVLYEGEEAAYPFINTLLAPRKLMAQKDFRSGTCDAEKQIGQKIVDSHLSFINYADLSSYQGNHLIGSYEIDGDGIIPQKELVLIDHGILKQVLNGRYPTLKTPQSTGSNRFKLQPNELAQTIEFGTLHIITDKPFVESKMKKELLKSAKKAGLKYAYIVRRLPGTASSLLFKTDVKTGEEIQVRAYGLMSPASSKLMQVHAVSDKENVMNYQLNYCNTSLIYPSKILLDNVEINVISPKAEEAPVLLPPLQR